MNNTGAHQNLYQVGELLALLHQRIDVEFGAVRVEGEISGLSQPRSGHRYFSLKDLDGQIRCAWFRQHIRGQTVGEGQKIIAHGRLAIYTPRGDLQLIVSAVEAAGEGALAQAFLALKKKLSAEGLFDAEHKPVLPPQISRLAIVSSAQAAALQDVLVTLKRRDPFIETRLHPVSVQGPQSATQIQLALSEVNADSWADAILLTRGGGSLEDLQSFNCEVVARAIAASQIPVVSAVGHETDFSISDFVATLRCPTPTAAAELLSQDRQAQLEQVGRLRARLQRRISTYTQAAKYGLLQLQARLNRQSPRRRLELAMQHLDQLQDRLFVRQKRSLTHYSEPYRQLRDRLRRQDPQQRILERRTQVARLQQRLRHGIDAHFAKSSRDLQNFQLRLTALNPRNVLGRGYAIVHSNNGLIERKADLSKTTATKIEWVDGSIEIDRLSK